MDSRLLTLVVLPIFNVGMLLALQPVRKMPEKEYSKWKASPLLNATHYWNIEDAKETSVLDTKKEHVTNFLNNVGFTVQTQLGKVLRLDGKYNWVEVPEMEDRCITNVQCTMGITVSFWMKYEGGDYIMAAGKYVATEESPGFRLQRDPETKFFILDVSNKAGQLWRIYIKELPRTWFHFTFTWKNSSARQLKYQGLKVYINGEMKLERRSPFPLTPSNKNDYNTRTRIADERDVHKMTFGKIGSLQEFSNAGKFQLGHVAVWKRALSADEVQKVRAASVMRATRENFCCHMKGSEKDCSAWDSQKCICPELKKQEKCKREKTILPGSDNRKEVVNKNAYCDKLVNGGQLGYCEHFVPESFVQCFASCSWEPVAQLMESRQPKKHFSQEALIFALLGCVGGLLLLFGIMFYFWKVYRTRYHGAFVPPSKCDSMSETPHDYDDMKWPSRHIDTSAFFIKDVPPKKRALPLIAAHKTSVYRYQPPEFE